MNANVEEDSDSNNHFGWEEKEDSSEFDEDGDGKDEIRETKLAEMNMEEPGNSRN